MGGDERATNEAYYGAVPAGQMDYWLKMAAPRHRRATLLGALAQSVPKRLADLGCGNGELLREIHARFPLISLSGIDLSAEQIEVNRAASPDIRWQTWDLDGEQALPEDFAGGFGAVVASEIIEHVQNPRRFLENARRLAEPGGRLLLSTQSGRVHNTERRVGHVRHFSSEEMTALLREAGWTPVRVWNTGYPFHDWSKAFANRNPDKTMADFSGKPYGARQNLICWALRLAFSLNSSSRGAQLYAVAENAAR
jgi:2-polyprenyl-3-methyl-5-hydroxy-6-metoxy-1,4-benzoquinol methylase